MDMNPLLGIVIEFVAYSTELEENAKKKIGINRKYSAKRVSNSAFPCKFIHIRRFTTVVLFHALQKRSNICFVAKT